MAERAGEIAGIFVQAPGTGKSIVAGAAGGVLARMAVERGGADGTLGVREIGYVSVSPEALVLYKAKRKVLMGGFSATDDVLATIPKAEVAGATLERGKLLGTLQINFTDGSGWVFEVPKVGNKGADQAVAAMSTGA